MWKLNSVLLLILLVLIVAFLLTNISYLTNDTSNNAPAIPTITARQPQILVTPTGDN